MDGSFTDLTIGVGDVLGPPDNCPACLLGVQRANDKEPVVISGGLSYLGKTYHHNDYVLIAEPAPKAPASIGIITRIQREKSTNGGPTLMVTVRLLGRMADLLSEESFGSTAPADTYVDEVNRSSDQ